MLPADYGSEHPTTGDTAHQHHTGPIVDPVDETARPARRARRVRQRHHADLRLATGIFILPLRHPLLTARMTLTLQDVAGGRFMLGVGSGWLEEEFDALGVPFDERAARLDETLAVLRAAWGGDEFSHDGPLFPFGNVKVSPEPVRRAADPRRQHRAGAAPGRHGRRRLVQLRHPVVRRGRPAPRPSRRTARRGRRAAVSSPSTSCRAPRSADLARYEAEGFEHVLVWADELWPRDGDLADKRAALAAAAADLGVERHSGQPSEQHGVATARG